jgi:hypothetical protein
MECGAFLPSVGLRLHPCILGQSRGPKIALRVSRMQGCKDARMQHPATSEKPPCASQGAHGRIGERLGRRKQPEIALRVSRYQDTKISTHLAERLSRRQNGQTLGLRGIGSFRWRNGSMSRDEWRNAACCLGEMASPTIMSICIFMCATIAAESNRTTRKKQHAGGIGDGWTTPGLQTRHCFVEALRSSWFSPLPSEQGDGERHRVDLGGLGEPGASVTGGFPASGERERPEHAPGSPNSQANHATRLAVACAATLRVQCRPENQTSAVARQ